MTTLIIIQILIFSAFPAFVWSRYGVLSSISAASYRLQGNAKGWFSLWLIALAVSLLFYDLYVDMGLWNELMAVGFTITGMSPDHKSSDLTREDEYHTWGTIMAIACGFAGLYLTQGVLIPMLTFIGMGALFFVIKRNWIWWVELTAMAMIAWGMLTI